MGKEQSQPKETLHPEMRSYLREIATVAIMQQKILSVGGRHGRRSSLGILSELSYDLTQGIVKNENYLFAIAEKTEDRLNYLGKLKKRFSKTPPIKPAGTLLPQHTDLFTRLAVLYEWEKTTIRHGTSSANDIDVGLGTVLIRDMIGVLVDKETVLEEHRKLGTNPQAVNDYSDSLIMDIKYMDEPLPGFHSPRKDSSSDK